jgi:hypothetical protein
VAAEANRLPPTRAFTNRVARLIETDPTTVAVVSVADSHHELVATTFRAHRPWFFAHSKTSLTNENTRTTPLETRKLQKKDFQEHTKEKTENR